jgi:hypothetical protein
MVMIESGDELQCPHLNARFLVNAKSFAYRTVLFHNLHS